MRIPSTRVTKATALLAVMASAAALAGCTSGTGGDGDGERVLKVQSQWIEGNPSGDAYTALIKEFTEETGIKVESEYISDDAQPYYEAAVLAGEEADVVILNLVGDNTQWVVDGLTVDTASYVDDWGLSDMLTEGTVASWTNSDGQMSGLPYASFVWPIWYNMDLLGQAGITEIPTTFDELVDDAAALRAAGIQPFVVGGNDWPGNNWFTWMAQQYLTEDESKDLAVNGGFCEANAKKGLDLIAQMRDEGVFSDNTAGETSDTMTSLYNEGQVAMFPSGSWAIPNVPEDIAAVTEFGGFPLPDGAAWDKPTMFFGDTGTGFQISNKGAEKLDMVEEFVKFFYRPESVQKFVDLSDAVPALQGDWTSENALLAKAIAPEVRENNAGIVSWDTYLPAGADSQPIMTAMYAGESTDNTCKALDDLWASVK